MQIHKFAATYPITRTVLNAMVVSMCATGFDPAHPIAVTPDGVLLDGRTRSKAADIAGVKPHFRVIHLNDAGEAIDFIRRANDIRRGNMTIGQKVLCEIKQRAYFGETANDSYEIGKACGVGTQAAQRVIAILGTEYEAQVWADELNYNDAYRKLHPSKPKRPARQNLRARKPAAGEAAQDTTPTKPAKPEPTIEDRLGATKAKNEAKDLKRQVRDLLKELEKEKEVVNVMTRLTGSPLPPVMRYELGSGLREATAVALGSDWHTEEMVKPNADTAGNMYNLAIADLRITRFFSAIIWGIEHEQSAFKIRNLVLWLGGDMNTGQLHEENLETGQLSPFESMLWNQQRIIAGIDMLLASHIGLEQIDVVCSYGNHGRFTHRMRAATGAGHNMDWLMYQNLATHFKDEPRVQFLADTAEHQYHKVYDFDLHFHHGHRVSFGGGVGGITIPINKATSQWDKARACHYHHYGHFHQYIDTGSTLVNGSLIGYNAYAMSIKATPEKPQQAFYLLDSKRGKSKRMPLWVSDPDKEIALWGAERLGQ